MTVIPIASRYYEPLGTDWTTAQNTVFHDPLKLISWTFIGALAEKAWER
jgi:hypothetical protein